MSTSAVTTLVHVFLGRYARRLHLSVIRHCPCVTARPSFRPCEPLCERELESGILRGLFFTAKGHPPHGPSHKRASDRRSAGTEKTTMIVAAFAPSVCGVASIDSERVANHKACAGA